METKEAFLSELANITAHLDAENLGDRSGLFRLTLQQMARDARRWLDDQWKTPAGDTTSIERAIQVLGQDLVVLLGHAHEENIQHALLNDLLDTARRAALTGLIEDRAHLEIFSETRDSES
ncbi:MAG: hypothetical protein COA73_02135 [Candidatus Hydrogenedentota bacterium]|nr:MAG: hypothetical protein COA73_02135 [Candidatus Hydrogenedentota bacterium]